MERADRPPGPEAHAVCSAACPQCGAHALGMDPGFTLEVAAMLIPCSFQALRKHLRTFTADYPARYALRGSRHRRLRILYASELLQIRRRMFRGPGAP